MQYFIPAWYKGLNWEENEQEWYVRRDYSEFDETIKQIQLFHRNIKKKYKILLLSYAPNFRHFLHRQGLLRANYWSCFDCIQQIKRTKVGTWSFHDLKWPDDVEFVYSPFCINVLRGGRRYAVVDFGENGNPISVDMFENDMICRKNIYDDRGFLSSTIVYEGGVPINRDYLMENGKWKLRVFNLDGHVEINPSFSCYSLDNDMDGREYAFKKMRYDNLEAVIEEVFTHYIEMCESDDAFFVSIHKLHIELLQKVLVKKRIIATFFENKYDLNDIQRITSFLNTAYYVITDSEYAANCVREKVSLYPNRVFDISPYDTRIDFGISQQMSVQNILIPVDKVSDEQLEKIILQVSKYLEANDKSRVHYFTRNSSWDITDRLIGLTRKVLEQNNLDTRWIVEDKKTTDIDDDEELEAVEQRFFVDQCIDERSISKCLNEQRVILDFRNAEDTFLSITAISKGVPRITTMLDQFVEHGKNGYLIQDENQIFAVLSFYLDELENWNRALVECYNMSQKYTTDVLIEAWRGVLDLFE